MKSSVEFFAAIAAKFGSDRKAAPILGVSQATFSRWHSGEDHPSDERCLQIAQLLKLDPAYVTATVRADRSKSEETRAMWERIAATFAKAAGVAAVAIAAGIGAAPQAQAGFNITVSDRAGIHIVSNRRRKAPRRSLGAFAAACAQTLGLLPGDRQRPA